MVSPTGVEPVTYPLGGGRAILCATGTEFEHYIEFNLVKRTLNKGDTDKLLHPPATKNV